MLFGDVGIALNGLSEFKSIMSSYMCLIVIVFGSFKNSEKV
jgi:hypothetical protein